MGYKMKGAPVHYGTKAHKSALKQNSPAKDTGAEYNEKAKAESKSGRGLSASTIKAHNEGHATKWNPDHSDKTTANKPKDEASPTTMKSPAKHTGEHPTGAIAAHEGHMAVKKTKGTRSKLGVHKTAEMKSPAKQSDDFGPGKTWPEEGVKPRKQTKKDKKAEKKFVKKANKIFNSKKKDKAKKKEDPRKVHGRGTAEEAKMMKRPKK